MTSLQSCGHKLVAMPILHNQITRIRPCAERLHCIATIYSDGEIMWGDYGVANFFIHPDDLAKKDFPKVLYNWDCS